MDICRREFGFCLLAGLAKPVLAAPTRPKLLVLVLIEQLRPDTLEAVAPQFGPDGFRRFLEKGACFTDCRHLASTFPATSTATLATGAWPAQHGIVADSWYSAPGKRLIRASEDDLLATTLAAEIAADPKSRAFVLALDETPAGLFSGSPSVHRFWMDEHGRFTTGWNRPAWLDDYNRLMPMENMHGAAWRALGARPDAPPLRTLTFDPDRPADFFNSYKASPFAEEAQFEFAGELIRQERLGQGDTQDFLCLIAGSSALLGYETGGRSPLMGQMALRLDQHLGYLFDTLTKATGENGFTVALAGAHGAPPAPGEISRPRMAVSGEFLAQSVQRALADGAGGKVERYVYPFLYLDASGFRDAEPIRIAAARAAMERNEVAAFFTAGGLCSASKEWERRFRNSFHPKRSGDVMFSYRPEYIEDYGAGYGISYGSLYNYDARVPLFFYGPQIRAGVFESPVESVDVTATLARIMGVPAPSSATGRVLSEALGRGEDK